MDSNDRQRANDELSYLLHRRAFRDSSQIIDVFSREHGRLSLVARGIRARKSRLKSALQAFTPLYLSWSIRGDLGTLSGAETHGVPRALTGDAMLAGFYLNELILKLTHRFDPQPEVFDLYNETLSALADGEPLEPTLRLFEMRLLRLLGYGVQLQNDIVSGERLRAEDIYRVRPEEGPMKLTERTASGLVFSGAVLLAIAADDLRDTATCKAAKRIARAALDIRLDGKELRSRTVMLAMKEKQRKHQE